MIRRHINPDVVVASTLVGCLIAMLFGLAFEHGRLPWTIGLVSALPPFAAAWAAAKQKWIVTPYALFAAGYGAYNGLLLMRFAFLDTSDLTYPITVTSETVLKSAIISALGSVAIVLVWLFRSDRGPMKGFSLSPQKRSSAFLVGVLFFFVSLGLYWLSLHQMGGFVASVTTERVERFQLMRAGFSVPYVPFGAMSIALLLAGSDGEVWLRRITWVALSAWIGLLLLEGERALILQFVLAAVGTLAALHPEPFRMRKATITVIASLVLLLLAFAQARLVIPLLIGGEDLSFIQGRNMNLTDPFSIVKPEKTELGGPYLSVLEAVSTHRQMLLGQSYIETLPTVLPRFLYPGTKPFDLASTLASNVSGGDLFVMGWGYSPNAEAYRNFGMIGVPFVMAAWGLLFLWLGSMHGRGMWGLFLPSMLLINAVLVNRSDFRAVYVNVIFSMVVLVIAVVLMNLWSSSGEAKHRLMTRSGDTQQ
jgi:hypothetical protein